MAETAEPNRHASAVAERPPRSSAGAAEFALRVAYARHFEAAAAVAQCVAQFGTIAPTLLVVFCGGKHDPKLVLEALRGAYGPVPVVGGSAAGAIAAEGFGYSGLELAVLAFADAGITPRPVFNTDLLEGEIEAGRALGARVAAVAEPGALVLLFFDSVATSTPLRLHPASSILDGFHEGLGGKHVELIGGGLLTDMNLSDGWVFVGDEVLKHAAVALVFPPRVHASTVVLHGCRPGQHLHADHPHRGCGGVRAGWRAGAFGDRTNAECFARRSGGA